MLNDMAALYSDHLALFAGSVFILGLVMGSFLNVVIYRLPIILDREWRAQAAMLDTEIDGTAIADPLPSPSPPPPPPSSSQPSPSPLQSPAPSSAPPSPSSPSAAPRTTTPPDPADRMTLSTPRSACPVCKAPIAAWQNIPLVSWLVLRGRCAACNTKISIRYPLVELATGLLSAGVAWHFGFGAGAVCALILTWALVALTGIDIDHQLLPDNITLPLLWAGLLAAVVIGPLSGRALPVSPREAILGAAGGYLSLWLVFHAFRLVTGKEGMGYGDFKLFGALGAWLGWKQLPLIILLAAATGAVLGILMIVVRGRDRAAPMPFGPYLAAAGWLAMMYGDSLMHGYLRLSGLEH